MKTKILGTLVIAIIAASALHGETRKELLKRKKMNLNTLKSTIETFKPTENREVTDIQWIKHYKQRLAEITATKEFKAMSATNQTAVKNAYKIASQLILDALVGLKEIVSTHKTATTKGLLTKIQAWIKRWNKDLTLATKAEKALGPKFNDYQWTKEIKQEAQSPIAVFKHPVERNIERSEGLLETLKTLESINQQLGAVPQ